MECMSGTAAPGVTGTREASRPAWPAERTRSGTIAATVSLEGIVGGHSNLPTASRPANPTNITSRRDAMSAPSSIGEAGLISPQHGQAQANIDLWRADISAARIEFPDRQTGDGGSHILQPIATLRIGRSQPDDDLQRFRAAFRQGFDLECGFGQVDLVRICRALYDADHIQRAVGVRAPGKVRR
jgi:hypothetical protein